MSYPGGKGASGTVQAIINQQPPHENYIEPFLGSGAVLRAKRPAPRVNMGFDLDRSTIDKFAGAGSGYEIFCEDGLDWLARADLGGGDLVYCDPPYLMKTRSVQRSIYKFEWNDGDHRRFLSIVRYLRCMVQISGYYSGLYKSELKGWRSIQYRAMTRGGVRIEHLWMNYPEPDVLHDWHFLGANYRERENLKRKAKRWVSRLSSLPRLERLAIFEQLSSSIGTAAGAGHLAGDTGESAVMRRPTPADAPVGPRDRTPADAEVLQ